MTRVGCLPLDSRPVSARLPADDAAWAGAECLMPRPDEMDDFTRPAPFEASQAFLERAFAECGAISLSVDKLCFGSLLGSRTMAVGEDEALARLDWLAALKRRYPNTPVHAFGVILRASISALASGDLEAYHAMSDYSYYTGRAEALGDDQDRRRAEAAMAHIPESVLETYRAVRKRNHAVNLRCVELAQRGVLDSLALLMEDAPAYGFHRSEQADILRRVSPDDRIWLHNGADEGSAVTVMKAILAGRRARADVIWLTGEGHFTALYEDRPFIDNMRGTLAHLGVDPVLGSDWVIAVAAPPDGVQREAADLSDSPALRAQAEAADRLIASGKRVYLLDIVGANGGCLPLMRALTRPDRLWGYSAWNTASNALGTLAAQLVSDQLAGRMNAAARSERFLDDLMYQSLLRARLNERVAGWGDDPFRLKDKPRAEEALRGLYAACGEPLLAACGRYDVSLPWARTFECDAKAEP